MVLLWRWMSSLQEPARRVHHSDVFLVLMVYTLVLVVLLNIYVLSGPFCCSLSSNLIMYNRHQGSDDFRRSGPFAASSRELR